MTNPLSNPLQYDVAIVGYGPVGQAMANFLGMRGHRVVVLEKHDQLYGAPRAGHCDGETMRLFQHLGLADELELLMRPILSYELVSAQGQLLKRVKIGESGSGWKASYLFHQPELETVLDKGARRYANCTVLMGHEVTGIEEAGNRVVVSALRRKDEHALALEAKFVVGADGAKSTVRKIYGIEQVDLGFEPYEFMVIDLKHNDPDRDLPSMGEVRQILDPRRPTTAGRWNGNSWSRWEFMLLPGETAEIAADEARCWAMLEQRGIARSEGKIERRTVYRFESRIAKCWRQGRMFLIGDAAHTMPPFMAQGLCSGLRDVANLGWKLDAVLRGASSEALLSSYQRERDAHVREITEMAMEVGRLVTITDPVAAAERDAKLLQEPSETAGGMPMLKEGFIADSDQFRLAGVLSPQGRVHKNGRTARLDDLVGEGWALVSRHATVNALTSENEALMKALRIQRVHVTRGCSGEAYLDLDATYAAWFKENGVRAFLQRPDRQIFGAVESIDDVNRLLSHLEARASEYGLIARR